MIITKGHAEDWQIVFVITMFRNIEGLFHAIGTRNIFRYTTKLHGGSLVEISLYFKKTISGFTLFSSRKVRKPFTRITSLVHYDYTCALNCNGIRLIEIR